MGGFDPQSHRVGDGMINADKFHRHRAEFHDAARFHHVHGHLARQTMLLELGFHQRQRQPGAVQGKIHLLEQIGQSADMVLMPVSEHDALDAVLVLLHIGEVGQHNVHTQHIVVRESHAAVDQESVVAVFKEGDVLADFVETAQRRQLDRGDGGLFRPPAVGAGRFFLLRPGGGGFAACLSGSGRLPGGRLGKGGGCGGSRLIPFPALLRTPGTPRPLFLIRRSAAVFGSARSRSRCILLVFRCHKKVPPF